MPIADRYRANLRQALVGAVETKLVRQRRRAAARRVVFAMVVMAAVIATVVTVSLPDDRADASLEVEVRDGSVFVRLLDFENRPEEIVGALRNAGIDAAVAAVPVGPSNVGRFVGYSTTQGGAVEITGGNNVSFAAFSVAPGFDGQLRLSLGRAASAGELWGAASNAMAKGEVLSCRDLRGLSASEAARRLTDVRATVSWVAVPGQTLAPGAELREPYAGWRVVDALSPAPDLVVMHLTVDGRWPYLTRPPEVDPSCKGK